MSKQEEIKSIGKTAALTSEIAAANIKKYLELHQGTEAGVVQVVRLVMKLADDANEELSKAIDSSAQAAINNLQRYLTSKGE